MIANFLKGFFILLTTFCSTNIFAVPFVTSDGSVFSTISSNNSVTLNFESFEANSPNLMVTPQRFTGFTVSVNNGNFLNNEVLPSYATDGNSILTFDGADIITFEFDNNINFWGSDIIDAGNFAPVSFFASLDGGSFFNLISGHSGGSANNIFIGIVDLDVGFKTLSISTTLPGDSIAFDRLMFGSTQATQVPEPSMFILYLFSTAFIVFGLFKRNSLYII